MIQWSGSSELQNAVVDEVLIDVVFLFSLFPDKEVQDIQIESVMIEN